MLGYLKDHALSTAKEMVQGLGLVISASTTKRYLNDLIQEGLVVPSGKNKNRRYDVSPFYDLLRSIDVEKYFEKEIDERVIRQSFDQQLMRQTLSQAAIFNDDELIRLNECQQKFNSNAKRLTTAEFNNEMERLAIDLSWKSSQIEGNTYSLLETERLLKHKETASGKTRDEATMLLNHKEALDFIVSQKDYINPLTVSSIEDIHSILIKDLGISRNIRNGRLGISGTNYKPLDNDFQIREALADMCELINSRENVFEKALLALVLISYIQPFADGNKRTGRIISNALLIRHGHCPISFRTIDSVGYKKAMLVFYEQTCITPFKKIFIDQFKFAVDTYF